MRTFGQPVARALAALLCIACATASAHGPLDEQIADATARIAREPSNAQRYLHRAELHRVHEDWNAALADYAAAAALAPGDETIDFLRGRTLQQAGRPAQAVVALDRYLARHPDSPDALVARARALAALGRSQPAAADYTHAIMRTPRPDPDLYLERAGAEAADRQLQRALDGIDAGIARLGPVPALELRAVDIEVKMGRVDRALARLDAIAARSPRKETWLARRGEILDRAGRRDEAAAAYSAALASIEALPPAARQTLAMAELEVQVRGALTRR